ncbi:MAG TPA: DnaD domain protein [Oscillospiraceae bacterium]|nr:DnaD domain protein [Oscillospiraceae bacterium]
MSFSINLGAWNSVFAVPSALVDRHIKLAGSVQLKVLLWVLRHAGENFDAADISAALGANTADVNDAMRYWIETGLIGESTASNDEVLLPAAQESAAKADPFTPTSTTSIAPVAPTKEEPPQIPAKQHRLQKPDGVFVAERMLQSEEIGFLMQESQQILGRPISPALSSTLLMIHDDYGLPVDVIIMLLQYVKSNGKDNTHYIEAVAKNWVSDGIFTHEKAEDKLRQLDEIAKAWRVVENTVGISHRSPSAKEEQQANRWMLEWKFSADMVREAYERCVNSTGKLSMSYMNTILERWHKNNITTTKEAAAEQSEKAATRKKEKERQSTYDIDEYERMSVLDTLSKE